MVRGPQHNRTGKSYIVFGKPGIGQWICHWELNGTAGFKIIGEAIDDASGWSLNGIGDINVDGYPDLLIGCL